jgi:transposase
MLIIGCDFHPSFQQIAFVDQATGEVREARLTHADGEAERFYLGLNVPARVGIEATGRAAWFERLLFRLGHELWVGDAARIRAAEVRKQKTDRRDAALLLRLLREDRFPRIWVPTAEERDRRQLVLHRHGLVQLRTRVKNRLQSLAINEGMHRGGRLWSAAGREQLRQIDLLPWTGQRRNDLLEMLEEFDGRIAPLDDAVRQQAEADPAMRRLMTHPGVGPVVASAFVLTVGDPLRFRTSKQLVSYLGLAPTEYSSAGHQRLGHISKQGNSLMRSLLVEGAHVAVRFDAGWKRQYVRLAMKKSRALAITALARKLAVRLWWMWKLGLDYECVVASGSHAE